MNTIQPGVLKVCTYSGFAPVCSVRDDGKTPWGTDISFLEKFAAKHDLRIEWTVLNRFQGIWQEPGKGSCDIAAAGISETEERKKESPGVVWSREYFHVKRSFLIRASDQDTFRTIADFAGKTIAVTKGSTADVDIQKRNPKNAAVVYYQVQSEALDALQAGVIDAFGEGDVSNDYLATTRPGLIVIDRHELVEEPAESNAGEPFTFPVREESGILDALNEWLLTMTDADYTDIGELKPRTVGA